MKLDTKSTYRYADRQTGRVDDSSFNRDLSHPVRGIELSRARQLRPIPVLWWSSRMVRLAQQGFVQLHHPTIATQRLEVPNLPGYVLAIEGDNLCVFFVAAEDLHDTVFLELPDGVTFDLQEVLISLQLEEKEK